MHHAATSHKEVIKKMSKVFMIFSPSNSTNLTICRLFLKSIVKYFVFGFPPKQSIYLVLSFLSFLA
jgi:hypothetical protein